MKQEVNLYLVLPVLPKWRLSAENSASLCGIFLLALLLLYGFMQWSKNALKTHVAKLQHQQAEATVVYDKLVKAYPKEATRSGLESQVQELTAQVDGRMKIVETLKQQGSLNIKGFSEYLTGLATQIIPSVWLNQISLVSGGAIIDLTGQALNTQNALNFVKKLSQADAYKNMSIKVSSLKKEKETSEVVTFTITGISDADHG